jgi:hypothetical protein
MNQTAIATLVAAASVTLLAGCGGEKDSIDAGATTTPVPQAVTPIPAIRTAFASGGSFATADEGEPQVGFRLLRVDRTRFPITSELGLSETFPEIGLPRARQVIVVPGHEYTMQFVQEPEGYRRADPPSSVVSRLVGEFSGQLWRRGTDEEAWTCFRFKSGEVLAGSAIVAEVCGMGGYSEDEIVAFVAALTFGEP